MCVTFFSQLWNKNPLLKSWYSFSSCILICTVCAPCIGGYGSPLQKIQTPFFQQEMYLLLLHSNKVLLSQKLTICYIEIKLLTFFIVCKNNIVLLSVTWILKAHFIPSYTSFFFTAPGLEVLVGVRGAVSMWVQAGAVLSSCDLQSPPRLGQNCEAPPCCISENTRQAHPQALVWSDSLGLKTCGFLSDLVQVRTDLYGISTSLFSHWWRLSWCKL